MSDTILKAVTIFKNQLNSFTFHYNFVLNIVIEINITVFFSDQFINVIQMENKIIKYKLIYSYS